VFACLDVSIWLSRTAAGKQRFEKQTVTAHKKRPADVHHRTCHDRRYFFASVAQENQGQALQATALVHEAYSRLVFTPPTWAVGAS